MAKPKKLRELLNQEGPLMIPGAHDPLVAKIVQKNGFQAVYCSGGATANCIYGLPDIGLVTMEEMTEAAGRIARSVDIPAISDADTGYGNAINLMRTVNEFEREGIAGIHIEDQVAPKRCGHVAGKQVITPEEMIGKIKAAVAARKDPNFIIIARVDSKSVFGFDDAVQRGKLYAAAGADVVFPEALESVEELEAYAKAVSEVPLLANMTEFGKSPNLDADELYKLGYKITLFPATSMRVMAKCMEDFFAYLYEKKSQVEYIKDMYTRAQLYELIEYNKYTEFENKYLKEGGVKPI